MPIPNWRTQQAADDRAAVHEFLRVHQRVDDPTQWTDAEMEILRQRAGYGVRANEFMPLTIIDEASFFAPSVWNPIVEYRFAATDIRPITARDFYRVPPVPLVPRPATRSVVHETQAAFRYSYTCPVQDRLKERGRMCYCSASSEPHLHQRLRRVGHLPMITVKELPE